mmetsp:Transcript_13587/g.39144  ORF Transcript_13587/g.39144 Transcript_13587/m.39144 type:complete len:213 (-) Transcript_13587:181-819(-)
MRPDRRRQRGAPAAPLLLGVQVGGDAHGVPHVLNQDPLLPVKGPKVVHEHPQGRPQVLLDELDLLQHRLLGPHVDLQVGALGGQLGERLRDGPRLRLERLLLCRVLKLHVRQRVEVPAEESKVAGQRLQEGVEELRVQAQGEVLQALRDDVDHVVDKGLRGDRAVDRVRVLRDEDAQLHGRGQDRSQREDDAANRVANLLQGAVESGRQDVI